MSKTKSVGLLLVRLNALVLALLLVSACSGEGPKAAGEPKASEPSSESLAIHGYYEREGKLTRVTYELGNQTESDSSHAKPASLSGPGQKTQYERCTGACAGGGSYAEVPIENSARAFAGDDLLRDITTSCRTPPAGGQIYYQSPSAVSPWSPLSSTWYTFDTKGDGCDAILQREEILLCMADHLSAIADAVDTVRFQTDTQTLVFPPQELKDRFIVRDLALNVLTHLATFDNELPVSWSGLSAGYFGTNQSCSSAYGAVYSAPQLVMGSAKAAAYKTLFSTATNTTPLSFENTATAAEAASAISQRGRRSIRR